MQPYQFIENTTQPSNSKQNVFLNQQHTNNQTHNKQKPNKLSTKTNITTTKQTQTTSNNQINNTSKTKQTKRTTTKQKAELPEIYASLNNSKNHPNKQQTAKQTNIHKYKIKYQRKQ